MTGKIPIILCASFNPLGPGIDPGAFGEENVVVAKAEIPEGERITAGHLALVPIPNGSLPEGVFRKMDDVVGRVAITPIGIRETITNMKLAPAGTGAGLSAAIPKGWRHIARVNGAKRKPPSRQRSKQRPATDHRRPSWTGSRPWKAIRRGPAGTVRGVLIRSSKVGHARFRCLRTSAGDCPRIAPVAVARPYHCDQAGG